ncbi:MAG TPA: hypothetical protein VM689_05190 [Aliidongia sp.]|nr:hypothetical protein [Aliidongia sp.]
MLLLGAALLVSMPAEAQTTTEFPLPQLAGGSPGNLIRSPDAKDLWFVESNLSKLVQVTPDGQITAFSTPTPNAGPINIFSGFSNQIWFSEPSLSQIGVLTINIDQGLQPITEFRTPTPNSGPGPMTRGADFNLWFVEQTANQIGTMDINGNFLGEFPIPTANAGIPALVIGPDDALWFVETSGNKIGRITTGGAITEFPVPTANAGLIGLVVGHDGAFWFPEKNAGRIGRITTAGTITEFPITTGNAAPQGLANGADHNIWFIETAANQIGVMTTNGSMVAEFPIPSANSGAASFVTALDQALWFAEPNANKLGRITSDGTIQEFPIPTANSGPHGLIAGPDQAIWFTESANQIGRILPFSNSVNLFAAVLPSARSVGTGETATAFATIINAGSVAGTACRIGLNSTLLDFHYQTTSPADNTTTGAPDTPVDIPAGASQSFVISITSSQPTEPVFFELGFYCANSNPAPATIQLNTITLRVSDTPIPDIIALNATATQDGIVDLPGNVGVNAFALATTNLGASATITAEPFLSTAGLPVNLSICQTDPATSACLAPPAPTVTTLINTGDTPTFSVFVSGNGNVPFDPVANRINVFFVQNNLISGLTSVAVRTQ